MNEADAHESVDALISDLKFLMGTRPHTGWPSMAEQALDYHSPPIAEHLLSWQYRRLQRAAHLVLKGLAETNAEQIRAGIVDIRTIENLEVSPTPTRPEAPGVTRPQRLRTTGDREHALVVDPELTIYSDRPIPDPHGSVFPE